MSSAPIAVCCLYASDDEPLRRALEKHVSAMRREGLISLWHDRQVAPGHDRIDVMDAHLDSAAVILLLVSSDFLDSDECYELALQRAMERHRSNDARVVPILVRPVDYQGTAFVSLSPLPTGGKAVTLWSNQDEAWLDVANGLRRAIGAMNPLPGKPPPTKIATANREAMLVRLERLYQDLLRDSLREAAWIELGLAKRPGAVQNAANLILRQATQSARSLFPGTSILQVYEQANHELLILGAPGSGKSTLLYQLGRDLIAEATQQLAMPLPVLFPLSSWANARLPLEKWMVEQLTSVLYRIPRKQSQEWVEQEQIVPLLDGLDEMEEAARPACIEVINAYQREYPLRPLVVCCRSEEYTRAMSRGHSDGRLLLQNAVEVQLLSAVQLDETLQEAGKPFAALRRELKQNAELRDLARTPLWLNMLLLTFKDTPVRARFSQRSVLEKQVFASYVERQVEEKGKREGGQARYTLSQTKHWLSFLAGQMRVHNQTTFAVELLQPDWLAKHAHLSYLSLLGVIGGLITSDLIIGQGFRLSFRQRFRKIELAEKLIWSWGKSRSGLIPGLITVLSIGLMGGLIGGPSSGLFLGLIGVLAAPIVGLIQAFQPTQYIERNTLSPGEGLRRSFQNGLTYGLIFGLIFGLICPLILVLVVWLMFGISYDEQLIELFIGVGLFAGPFGGLMVWLIFGLRQILQHYTLRFWLWRTGVFPFHVIAFLEDACARHLLRRVGGSYQFMHRLLLDYFADLEHEPPAPTDH